MSNGGRKVRAIRDRIRNGELVPEGWDPRTIPAATSLSPDELDQMDHIAGHLGECRSEFIRRAVFERLERERAKL